MTGWGDIYWVSANFIDSLRYTNFQPYVLNSIPDHSISVGEEFSYVVPDTTFFDDDGNETLVLSATLNDDEDLPGWLNFNPETYTFAGTSADTEDLNIKVTATDTAFSSVSDVFLLTIRDPISVKEIRNQKLHIYPNPTNNKIYIGEHINLKIHSYKIFNLGGKLIEQGNLLENYIDISGYEKGIYILNLYANRNIIAIEKFIVK